MNEITGSWMKAINERLKLDCHMTRRRHGKKAVPKRLVQQTWEKTFQNKNDLPKDWTKVYGVLVGITGTTEDENEGIG